MRFNAKDLIFYYFLFKKCGKVGDSSSAEKSGFPRVRKCLVRKMSAELSGAEKSSAEKKVRKSRVRKRRYTLFFNIFRFFFQNIFLNF